MNITLSYFLFSFFSQKEALERARLQEKPSQPRSSSEEDSPDSPRSSLVRMTLLGKLLINLICLLVGGGCCHWPPIDLISIERPGKG